MPNYFSQKLVTGLVLVGFMTLGKAQDAGSSWLLQVQDVEQKTRVEATIRFTSEPATGSCMAGEWRQIIIEEKTAQDENFFPLSGSLTYKFDLDLLILGRTDICDAYLFLSGKSGSSSIQGQFNSRSIMGGKKLGNFSLKRIR